MITAFYPFVHWMVNEPVVCGNLAIIRTSNFRTQSYRILRGGGSWLSALEFGNMKKNVLQALVMALTTYVTGWNLHGIKINCFEVRVITLQLSGNAPVVWKYDVKIMKSTQNALIMGRKEGLWYNFFFIRIGICVHSVEVEFIVQFLINSVVI